LFPVRKICNMPSIQPLPKLLTAADVLFYPEVLLAFSLELSVGAGRVAHHPSAHPVASLPAQVPGVAQGHLPGNSPKVRSFQIRG
uniref:Uncharacterized protein n=1 Tax=Apteryx owenii TaxID=8824 RepID=A0A8B9SBU7_APTOW